MMGQYNARLILTCMVLGLFLVSGVTGTETISPEEDFEDAHWGVEVGDIIYYTMKHFSRIYNETTVDEFYINITYVPDTPTYQQFVLDYPRTYERPEFRKQNLDGSNSTSYAGRSLLRFWLVGYWIHAWPPETYMETPTSIGHDYYSNYTYAIHTTQLYSKSDGAIDYFLNDAKNLTTGEQHSLMEIIRHYDNTIDPLVIATIAGVTLGGVVIIALVVVVRRSVYSTSRRG